jgi:quinol monooxygenase YgiN
MIVVVGRVTSDAEKRDQLIEVAQAIASASREEDGCIDYRFYEDTEQPNHFVFVEEWADQAALERHFGTPHIDTFMRSVPATMTKQPDVMFHTVASSVGLAEVSAARG